MRAAGASAARRRADRPRAPRGAGGGGGGVGGGPAVPEGGPAAAEAAAPAIGGAWAEAIALDVSLGVLRAPSPKATTRRRRRARRRSSRSGARRRRRGRRRRRRRRRGARGALGDGSGRAAAEQGAAAAAAARCSVLEEEVAAAAAARDGAEARAPSSKWSATVPRPPLRCAAATARTAGRPRRRGGGGGRARGAADMPRPAAADTLVAAEGQRHAERIRRPSSRTRNRWRATKTKTERINALRRQIARDAASMLSSTSRRRGAPFEVEKVIYRSRQRGRPRDCAAERAA